MSECPFDYRLYRTSYLVLPKLAIQAMPMEWRVKLEALLKEADDAGLQTPAYLVFRDVTEGNPDSIRGCKQVNAGQWSEEPFYRLTGGARLDPWANYRRGRVEDLCPGFTRVKDRSREAVETEGFDPTDESLAAKQDALP